MVLAAFINIFVFVFSGLIIARVLLSYIVRPANSLYTGVVGITEPLLDPVRKMLPTVSGLDIAPLAVLVLLEFVQFLVSKLMGS